MQTKIGVFDSGIGGLTVLEELKKGSTEFKDIFDFYLKFTSINKLTTQGYGAVAYQNVNILYLLIIVLALSIKLSNFCSLTSYNTKGFFNT